MSGIMKVFLLLAVVICISEAQLNNSGQQCLCQRVRNGIRDKAEVKDVQIYPKTEFCNKVEIVVTLNSGLRFCLNPELKVVKRMMTNIMKNSPAASTTPPDETQPSSTSQDHN